MSERVAYQLGDDGVATITLDDGKVNALSRAMLAEVGGAFDKAAADGAAVLLTGRPGVLSGGFDLRTLGGDDPVEAATMVCEGFELAERVLTHPRPVVVASPGHAIAMGTFLLLSADWRIGVPGEFRYVANEVAIGLGVPDPALAILRYRLTPADFDRAALLSTPFDPQQALAAGFLHEVVQPDALLDTARARAAAAVSGLNAAAHTDTKLRARAGVLRELRESIAEMRRTRT